MRGKSPTCRQANLSIQGVFDPAKVGDLTNTHEQKLRQVKDLAAHPTAEPQEPTGTGETVYRFKTDKLNISDDYEVALEWQVSAMLNHQFKAPSSLRPPQPGCPAGDPRFALPVHSKT